jgi:choline dehydrogenase
VRRLVRQEPLASYVLGETWPGAEALSDDEILDVFRRLGRTGYHIASTCRMGPDEESVVDLNLKVRGVSNLRVADTSIMPSLLSGNTNAPAMAMAWRGADIILAG